MSHIHSIPITTSGSAIKPSSHMGFMVCTTKKPQSVYITENITEVRLPYPLCFLSRKQHESPAAAALTIIMVISPSVIIFRGKSHTMKLKGLAR